MPGLKPGMTCLPMARKPLHNSKYVRKPKPLDPNAPGLPARRIAAEILDAVLRRKRTLDDQLDGPHAHPGLAALEPRDRALTRQLVSIVLRRRGTLLHLLATYLEEGLPNETPMVEMALLVGAAQILWLDVPNHAAVDLAVRYAQSEWRASHYTKLINAVLRRLTETGPTRLAELDSNLDTPDWLMARWIRAYGEETATAIAAGNAREPVLDLTVKNDPAGWALRLSGRVMLGNTVRLLAHGPVSQIDGFDEGAWWVQDAAAALPARLLGDIDGKRVADLCAAPGGKTAQLAAAGARVTAVDLNAKRLERVRQNLARLSLEAEVVAADATKWDGGGETFDAVLLDAPCSSTGTIRRHPDIAWLKLADLQRRLLDNTVNLLKPGGILVFCTCSLEPDEGVDQIEALLARDDRVVRQPVTSAELDGHAEWVTEAGDLRTLPFHLHGTDGPAKPGAAPRLGGMDGFYAARLIRR